MAESSVKGVVQTETFGFKWTIKRFFADCNKVGDHYTSPMFPVRYSDKVIAWYLMVYPKGEDEQSEGYVSVFIGFQCENTFEVTVDYECSIVTRQNSQGKTAKGSATFTSPTDSWGWEKFVKKDAIQGTENGALTDDTLTLSCKITFPPMAKDIVDKCYEYDEWQWQSRFNDKAITYEELYESGSFSDVTFDVGGNKIQLHKAILSCHSPVFKAMFEHEMKEKKESLVDVTDVDYDVMKELFRFVYSGKVDNIDKIVKELLIAADKYSVAKLKALCERTLYGSLTVDNAIEYLKVVDKCDTLHLKKLTIKFVVDNLKDIVRNSNFKLMLADLSRDVVAEVMEAVAEKN